MIIKAKFTGPWQSMGYVPGNFYELKVYKHNVVKRLDGTGRLPYESLSAFLKNWTDITHI